MCWWRSKVQSFVFRWLCSYQTKPGKYEIVYQGHDIAILALGKFFRIGIELYEKLKDKGIDSTLINPRYINVLDYDTLKDIESNHKIIVVLENGCIDGGFCSKISTYFSNKDNIVLNYAFDTEFYDRVNINDLMLEKRINSEKIMEDIFKYYE